MNIFRFRPAGIVCILMALFLAAGCADKRTGTDDPAMIAGAAPGAAGVWIFRHAVTLDLPEAGMTLPFTGVMRCNVTAGEAHAVALSGMGMTLLDMTVTGEGHTVRFMHPSLTKLPRAARTAAAVIGRLWLGKAAAEAGGPVVVSGGFLHGWAREITLEGKGFTVRLTLLEARREI